jgi:hypothetical protein
MGKVSLVITNHKEALLALKNAMEQTYPSMVEASAALIKLGEVFDPLVLSLSTFANAAKRAFFRKYLIENGLPEWLADIIADCIPVRCIPTKMWKNGTLEYLKEIIPDEYQTYSS